MESQSCVADHRVSFLDFMSFGFFSYTLHQVFAACQSVHHCLCAWAIFCVQSMVKASWQGLLRFFLYHTSCSNPLIHCIPAVFVKIAFAHFRTIAISENMLMCSIITLKIWAIWNFKCSELAIPVTWLCGCRVCGTMYPFLLFRWPTRSWWLEADHVVFDNFEDLFPSLVSWDDPACYIVKHCYQAIHASAYTMLIQVCLLFLDSEIVFAFLSKMHCKFYHDSFAQGCVCFLELARFRQFGFDISAGLNMIKDC